MKRRKLKIKKWGTTTSSRTMGVSNTPGDDIDFSDCEGYGC